MTRGLLSVLALGASSCARPAAVAVQNVPGMLTTTAPVPLPKTEVKDEKGQVMDPQPPVTFSLAPAGILSIEDTNLVPRKSGVAVLTAAVKDTRVSTTVNVEVRLVDGIDMRCVGNKECAFKVGAEFEVQGTAQSGTLNLDMVPVTWTSENPAVVKVVEKNKMQAVGAGTATLRAEAGGRSATRTITVIPPPEHVIVTCPASSRVKPVPADETKGEVCGVNQGESLDLGVAVLGAGQVLSDDRPDWESSSTKVAEVSQKGVVTAGEVGLTTVTAKLGKLESSVTVKVFPRGKPVPAMKAGACTADFPVDVMMGFTQEAKGGVREIMVRVACNAETGLACLALMLSKTANPTPAEHEAMRRTCCCQFAVN
jgi:hypothetical protein